MLYLSIALVILTAAVWDGWRRYLDAQRQTREFEKTLAMEMAKDLKAALVLVKEHDVKYEEAIKNFLEQQRSVTGFMVDRVAKSEGKVLNAARR